MSRVAELVSGRHAMSNDDDVRDRTTGLINEFTLALKRWGTIAAGVWLIVAVWAFYVSLAVFGVDLADRLKRRQRSVDPLEVRVWFWVAIGTTVITVVVAGRRLRRLRRLVQRSAEAEGRVVAVGRVAKAGLVPVTIVYRVEGVEYKTRRDVLDEDVAEGGVVRVLYDPADPGSCEVMPG